MTIESKSSMFFGRKEKEPRIFTPGSIIQLDVDVKSDMFETVNRSLMEVIDCNRALIWHEHSTHAFYKTAEVNMVSVAEKENINRKIKQSLFGKMIGHTESYIWTPNPGEVPLPIETDELKERQELALKTAVDLSIKYGVNLIDLWNRRNQRLINLLHVVKKRPEKAINGTITNIEKFTQDLEEYVKIAIEANPQWGIREDNGIFTRS